MLNVHRPIPESTQPSKLIRLEFVGNWFLFWLLFVSVIFLPFAILYLMSGTITIVETVHGANEFDETHTSSPEDEEFAA